MCVDKWMPLCINGGQRTARRSRSFSSVSESCSAAPLHGAFSPALLSPQQCHFIHNVPKTAFLTCLFLSVWWVHDYHSACIGEQFSELCFLLPTRWVLGEELRCQAWQQAPLCCKLPSQPNIQDFNCDEVNFYFLFPVSGVLSTNPQSTISLKVLPGFFKK